MNMYVQLLQDLKDFPGKEKLLSLMEKDNRSPLLIAADNNLLDTIPFLLGIEEIKETIHEKSDIEMCVLHFAFCANRLDIVKLLREKGASTEDLDLVNWRNSRGYTPLMIAMRNGYIDGVKYLLTIPGVKETLNAKDNQGSTALHFAAFKGYSAIAELLEPNQTVREKELANFRESDGSSLLIVAANNGVIDGVKYLLTIPGVKETLNAKNNNGFTALHLATVYGCSAIAELLEPNQIVREKELADFRDSYGNSLLMITALNGYIDGVKYLLTIPGVKETLNAKNNKGRMALHWAACRGHSAIAKLLETNQTVREKELADFRHSNGNSILIASALNGYIDGVKYLLTIPGVKETLNAKDNNGLTALHIAACRGHSAITELLEPNQTNREKELADFRDSDGSSLLIVAANNGIIDGVKYLLTIPGVKETLNAKNNQGLTALHCAVLNKLNRQSSTMVDIIKFLLASGADANISTYEDDEAIKKVIVAAQDLVKLAQNKEYKPDSLKPLLDLGASIYQTCDGFPILHVAIKSENASLALELSKMVANIKVLNTTDSNAINYVQNFLNSDIFKKITGTTPSEKTIFALYSYCIRENLKDEKTFEDARISLEDCMEWIEGNKFSLEGKSEINLKLGQLIIGEVVLVNNLGFDFVVKIFESVSKESKFYQEAQFEIAQLYVVCKPNDYVQKALLHIRNAGDNKQAKILEQVITMENVKKEEAIKKNKSLLISFNHDSSSKAEKATDQNPKRKEPEDDDTSEFESKKNKKDS